MGQMIKIDEARIRDHLGELVRGSVEETLNALLDAWVDELCGAGRHSARRRVQLRGNLRAELASQFANLGTDKTKPPRHSSQSGPSGSNLKSYQNL